MLLSNDKILIFFKTMPVGIIWIFLFSAATLAKKKKTVMLEQKISLVVQKNYRPSTSLIPVSPCPNGFS